MSTHCDGTVVIGGGIVGLATALAFAERGTMPIVLEAEKTLASHQTGHNSGVIHSGLYYKPGSAKARTCRAGLQAIYRFCEEENIPTRRCGKLVVAVKPQDLPRLASLEERAHANGVKVRRLGPEEIREREPEVNGVAGLWVSETGVVDYVAVCRRMASRIERLGGEIRVDNRVVAIRRTGSKHNIETTRGSLTAPMVVNCAGLQSDRIARMAGVDPEMRIVPFRGEYYVLRRERANMVRGLIYPVPDPALPFLGVHFTRGIDDIVEAGPNAVLAFKREGYSWGDVSAADIADWAAFPGFWRMIRKQWRNGIAEVSRSLSKSRFVESLQKLIPAITGDDVVKGGSGVRAQAVGKDGRLIDDFYIRTAPGIVNVLNAPSPAATASLAIGREIAAQAVAMNNAA
ncbi:MAG TPA: L-2-hydroxyglutarate oxidase [Gemmatimonadaceae bacterium]|nr:L-2-hydroxyglutarate oxidase [Gemmatimonadaceae bacterium]